MTKCKVCGADDESEFYSSVRTYCKTHWKEKVRNNRLNNIEYYRAYDRERGNRQGADYLKAYRMNNRKKYKATNTVNNAVRDGRLLKPTECEECGSTERLHGHHSDYSKPLDVKWLCSKCHKAWHEKNGPGINGGNVQVVLRFATKSGSIATLGKLKSLSKQSLKKYVRTHPIAWITA